MPFDNVNFVPSAAFELLRRAHQRLMKGWIQRHLSRMIWNPDEHIMGFCILGSISCNDAGVEMCVTDHMREAEAWLRTTYEEQVGEGRLVADRDIVEFNDHAGRTREEVFALVGKALSRMEAHERMHSVVG